MWNESFISEVNLLPSLCILAQVVVHPPSTPSFYPITLYLITQEHIVFCSLLHLLYKCILQVYVFCMYVFLDHDSSSFRSMGFVLLPAAPRCLEQCQHMLSIGWLKERNKPDTLWCQSPSLELGHPQKNLDWGMWTFLRISEFCCLWVLLCFGKGSLLTPIAK